MRGISRPPRTGTRRLTHLRDFASQQLANRLRSLIVFLESSRGHHRDPEGRISLPIEDLFQEIKLSKLVLKDYENAQRIISR